MNLETFFEEVKKEKYRLFGDQYTFEQLLTKSFRDHRVRNTLVFYLLTDKEMTNRFFVLADRHVSVRKLRDQLHLTLLRARKNSYNRPETVKLANHLLRRYFRNQSVCLVQSGDKKMYDMEVYGMEKFLYTLVNRFCNKHDVTPEMENHFKVMMKNVDLDRLFVPAFPK